MNLNKMDWLREIPEEELKEIFSMSGDLSLIYSLCGLETLIKLCENFLGMTIYISSKPIREAMRLYIKRYYNGSNRKDLAIKLGVSERFVMEVLSDDRDQDR